MRTFIVVKRINIAETYSLRKIPGVGKKILDKGGPARRTDQSKSYVMVLGVAGILMSCLRVFKAIYLTE